MYFVIHANEWKEEFVASQAKVRRDLCALLI